MTQPDLYTAIRVSDLPQPHVPSVKRACVRCKAEVWVAVDGIEVAQRCDVVCILCAEADGVVRSYGLN